MNVDTKPLPSQARWLTSVIPALGRLRPAWPKSPPPKKKEEPKGSECTSVVDVCLAWQDPEFDPQNHTEKEKS
jgi:hypothetical protein